MREPRRASRLAVAIALTLALAHSGNVWAQAAVQETPVQAVRKDRAAAPPRNPDLPVPGFVTALYDVRDILPATQDFPGPRLVADPSSRQPQRTGGEPPDIGHLLPGLLRNLLGEPATVEHAPDGQLLVSAGADQHRTVRDILAAIRRQRSTAISLSIAVCESATDPLGGTGLHDPVRIVNEEDAARFRPKARTSPNITVQNGQRSHVMLLKQRAHVTGYEVLMEAMPTARPVIGISSTGEVFDLRTVILDAEKQEILLDRVRIEFSTEAGEARETLTPWGIVEAPQIAGTSTTVTAKVGKGQSLLVGPLQKPATPADAPRAWVLITPVIQPPETPLKDK